MFTILDGGRPGQGWHEQFQMYESLLNSKVENKISNYDKKCQRIAKLKTPLQNWGKQTRRLGLKIRIKVKNIYPNLLTSPRCPTPMRRSHAEFPCWLSVGKNSDDISWPVACSIRRPMSDRNLLAAGPPAVQSFEPYGMNNEFIFEKLVLTLLRLLLPPWTM